MILRVVFTLVLSAAVTFGVYQTLEATYDIDQFASQEAQESLEVTEGQTAELEGSALWSDMIAYALIGAAYAALCGLVCNPNSDLRRGLLGAAVGLPVGALAGVAAAYTGHWYDHAIAFPREPMLYWVGRWGLMLLFIALACSLAAATAGRWFRREIGDAVAGGLIGAGAVVILYSLLAGVVTPLESHEKVLPAFANNRLLLIGLCSLIGLGILTMLGAAARRPSPRTRKPPLPTLLELG